MVPLNDRHSIHRQSTNHCQNFGLIDWIVFMALMPPEQVGDRANLRDKTFFSSKVGVDWNERVHQATSSHGEQNTPEQMLVLLHDKL
jgi:hypothetical protein